MASSNDKQKALERELEGEEPEVVDAVRRLENAFEREADDVVGQRILEALECGAGADLIRIASGGPL